MTADGHDPTAVHEDPASPTYGEKQDVLSDLPAGITSVQLGGAGGSGFYAFGAQMPNPFQERAADPFSARPSVDIRRSVDGRISVDFRRSIDARGKTDIDRGVSGVIGACAARRGAAPLACPATCALLLLFVLTVCISAK